MSERPDSSPGMAPRTLIAALVLALLMLLGWSAVISLI